MSRGRLSGRGFQWQMGCLPSVDILFSSLNVFSLAKLREKTTDGHHFFPTAGCEWEQQFLLLLSVWALCNPFLEQKQLVILQSSTKLVSVRNDWVGTGHVFLYLGHSLMCSAGFIVLNRFS